jgi:RHS repeat-associated protein
LGSVIAITDSAGNVVQRYEYDSFGNIISMLDPNFLQPYTYTSREYDPESGLYYYRARYYDSKVGRFISEDPILRPMNSQCSNLNSSPPIRWLVPNLIKDPKNFNSYLYVGNNPVNKTDPKGLSECSSYLNCCLCGDIYACGAYPICAIGGGINDCIADCLLKRYNCFQSEGKNVLDHIYCYAICPLK